MSNNFINFGNSNSNNNFTNTNLNQFNHPVNNLGVQNNFQNNNLSQLDVEETRETVEILNCGINRDTLSVLISMVENGSNPEALAAVVKEMKKENFSLGGTK